MKKFAKIGAIAASILMLAVGTCAFAACDGGNYSETYTGTLSEESYATTDAAAQAYLANEFDGNTTETTFVAYEKQKDLTAEEIATLSLGDVDPATVTSAEEGSVSYTVTEKSDAVSLAATDDTRTQKVIIIVIGVKHYYYTPATDKGDSISKSYYESVMDLSNYANCTYVYTANVTTSASYQGQNMKMKATTKVTMKLCETGAYLSMSMTGDGEPMETEIYLIATGTTLAAYVKADGAWAGSAAEYGSIAELLEMARQNQQFLDHTYFEKTSTGFKLTTDKFEIYVANMLHVSGLNLSKAEANYYVSEGRLAKETMEISLSANAEGVSTSVKMSATGKYSDYGTTTVTIPADLQAYIDAQTGAQA